MTFIRSLIVGVFSIITLAACHQETPVAVRSSSATGGAQGVALKELSLALDDYGLLITPPAKLAGKFERGGRYTWTFYVAADTLVLGDAVYVGDLQIDDAGLTAILLSPYGFSFPGDNINRLPVTEAHGLRWQHYISDAPAPDGKRIWRKMSVTRSGSFVYTSFAATGATELPWIKDRVGSFYEGITVVPQAPAKKLSQFDRVESTTALMNLWTSYMQRGRSQSCIKVAEVAMEVNPSLDWASLLLESHMVARAHADGLERADALLKQYPNAKELLWRRAFLSGKLGNPERALADYRAAIFGQGDRSRRTLVSYISYLGELEMLADRIIEVEELVEGQQDPELMLLLARAYFDAEMDEKARDVMAQLKEMASAVPEAASRMVELYMAEEDYESALNLSRYLTESLGDPSGNYLAGWVLIAEGRYGEARKELQQFLAHQPGHADARHMMELASSMLGKADTTFLSQPIEPVPAPVDLLESLEEVDAEFAATHGYYCRYWGMMHAFRKNQRLRTTRYQSYIVTDRKALERVSEFTFPFDPLYERIHVNSLKVYGPDGKLVAEGDLENYYLSNEQNEVLATQRKELHLPVPGVEVGSRVDVVVSWETLGPQNEMPFKQHLLADVMPTRLGFAGVVGDVDQLEGIAAHGAELISKQDGQLIYAVENPMTYPIASNLPPSREFLPSVWIGTADKEWDVLAKEYIEKTREHYDVDPLVKAKAQELIDPSASLEEKVQVLTRFVRDSLTYQGIEFGIRAQIPNKCADILTNRYGDCKDHTFLLMQLLRASGVDAVPALVDLSLEMNPELPDLSQFNHMILYVPDFMGGHFIDPTDKYAAIGSIPSGLGDQPALLLDLEKPDLVTIGTYRPDSSVVIINRTLSLEPDMGAMVTETVELSGYISAWVRDSFKHVSEAEYPLVLSNMLGVPALASLRNVTALNLEDREQSVRLSYEYSIDRQFHTVGNLLTGRLPATWEHAILRLPPVEQERKAPIWQRMPTRIESEVSLNIPSGYTLSEDLSMAGLKKETEFCGFDFKPVHNGEQVQLNGRFSTYHGIYPAERYQDRRKVFEDALNVVEHPLALIRK